VLIDIDQSGLLASGKTYEFASKSYFPKKAGKKGYQMSVAFAGQHSEVVDLYLDPRNTHCQYRFDDLLSSITSKYTEHLEAGKLIVPFKPFHKILFAQNLGNLKFERLLKSFIY